jgi:glycerol-3-phosphate dehydrogenase
MSMAEDSLEVTAQESVIGLVETGITPSPVVDLLVIGGGVNGAGIAADAAGRGLRVLLCEKADLASATSSSSTKLIHGGLRYLETYQFKLVHESLAEREVLLKAAPHIVWPMRFRLPHHSALRPVWMIRAGLFLYDHLSKRVSLPASNGLRFTERDPLRAEYTRGFEYSDCWVDDARLVVLNAMQAKKHGATILTRTACTALQTIAGNGTDAQLWLATLCDMTTGIERKIEARCVVNASGPWVSHLGSQLQPLDPPDDVRLVKGSHIVVPRMHDGDEAYLLQNSDGRVVFVIPYEDDYTLIGTTEQDYQGDPSQAAISQEEIDYLLDVTSQYFKNVPEATQIVYQFAGVRPLIDGETDNASKASRDYTLTLHKSPAPLLTVYGGKITTYRRLAESVMKKLQSVFPQMKPAWTADALLPGGEFQSQQTLAAELAQAYPWLQSSMIAAWVKRYGDLVYTLLDGAENSADLGALLGPGLYEREVNYLWTHEWARCAEDILWRRTKLGLGFSVAQQLDLDEYLRGIGSNNNN